MVTADIVYTFKLIAFVNVITIKQKLPVIETWEFFGLPGMGEFKRVKGPSATW